VVVPADERALQANAALAAHIKRLALPLAEEAGTRDVNRWLERETGIGKDTWNRRLMLNKPIEYTEIVAAARVLGLTPAELVRGAENAVGAGPQDGARVTPITRKRIEDMDVDEIERERAAATRDASDPQEFPQG
jgi:hypothetical protein